MIESGKMPMGGTLTKAKADYQSLIEQGRLPDESIDAAQEARSSSSPRGAPVVVVPAAKNRSP
jgi:hypothetical protein